MKTAALLLALGLSATPLWAQTAAAEPASAAADTAAAPAPLASPKDPFERGNRAVYRFNDGLDKAVLKPVAEAYVAAVPELVRSGVGNFFGNIGDVWSAVNKLLQGKVVQGAQMTLRVATNTVFGLGGVLDPATEMGLERQSEDFGQTLGYWGMPSGPYLVLPLFGPSTLRDAAALPLDKAATSVSHVIQGDSGVIAANGLQLTQTRAELLGASKLLGDVSLDPYAFLRDAYLARRRNLVWDGDPPDEDAAQ
ncbi:MlaA family lipoprotein [Ideonella alba]|uniref:VacJ family lipoprotein n=1 Tax=Ideonella alba TaxID=2824118 RepID=A0A941BFN4_9BURK|nr:VacJ family lipoprotein [Ideonella alba]MBQ0931232.1 VacJ family lipoprotein [Ideonella alba]